MTTQASTTGLPVLRCARCARLDLRGRKVCSACLSDQLEACEVQGLGRIASFTTIRRAPTQFRDRAPYEVVVVDLDAGLRITGRLDPDSPPAAMGAQVRLVSANGADTVFSVRSNP